MPLGNHTTDIGSFALSRDRCNHSPAAAAADTAGHDPRSSSLDNSVATRSLDVAVKGHCDHISDAAHVVACYNR